MKYSFFLKNEIPLSQNARHLKDATSGMSNFDEYKRKLKKSLRFKYPCIQSLESDYLYGKVVYIHKIGDSSFEVRDADNISKPLWDALNGELYEDDRQIRHRVAAKVHKEDDNVLSIDATKMSDIDYNELLDFFINSSNSDKQLVYVEIGDLDYTELKLGK